MVVRRGFRATGGQKRGEGEGGMRVECVGIERGEAGCQGGPLGHEIKK